MSAFVLRASTAAANAYIEKNLSGEAEVWLSFDLGFYADALTFWVSNSSGDFADLMSGNDSILIGPYLYNEEWQDDANFFLYGSPSAIPVPLAETWQHCELHYTTSSGPNDGLGEFYINGDLIWSDTNPVSGTVHFGSGAPSNGLGSSGDFYIDTTNNRLYGPKTVYSPPTILSIVTGGTPGSTTYGYSVKGIFNDPNGQQYTSTLSAEVQISTGAASLNATDYLVITADDPANISYWVWYQTTVNGVPVSPPTNGWIIANTSDTFQDVGYTVQGYDGYPDNNWGFGVPYDSVFKIRIGQNQSSFDASAVAYIRNVQAGTIRGASDIFEDDFSSDDFSAWDSVVGDVTLVSDPGFGEAPPPPVISSSHNSHGLYTQTGNFSFAASLSFTAITGNRNEFGFSGTSSSMGFSFVSGKIFDWDQSFVGVYNRIAPTTISGNVGPSTADYYIDGEPIAFGLSRPTGYFNHIYRNQSESLTLNLVVQGSAPHYTIQPSSVFSTGNVSVPIAITNDSNFPFEIFSGNLNSSKFSLLNPTGFINTGVNISGLNFRPSGIFSAGLNQVPVTLYTDFGLISTTITMSGKVDPFSGLFIEIIGSPTIQADTTNQYFIQFANSGIPIPIVPYLQYVSGSGIQLLDIPISGIYDVTATGLITYSGNVSGHIYITGSGYELSSLVSGIIDTGAFGFQWATGVQLSPISFLSTGVGTGSHYSGLATGIINEIISGDILDGSGFYHATWNNVWDNALRVGTGISTGISSGVSAWVDKRLGSYYSGVWLSCEISFNSNVLSFWDAGNNSANLFSVMQDDLDLAGLYYTTGSWHNIAGDGYGIESPPANKWFNLEMNYHSGITDFYVDKQLLFTDGGLNTLKVNKVRFGSAVLPLAPSLPESVLYVSFRVNVHDTGDCSDFIHLSSGGVDNNFIAVYADLTTNFEFSFYVSGGGATNALVGTAAADTWYTIEMKIVASETGITITPRIDGTEFASFSTNTFISIDSISFGGLECCFLNNHNQDDLKIGSTGWGTDDLFAVDFDDFSIVPPFDSTTGSTLDASDGTLFVSNGDGSEVYATKALTYP